MFSLQSFSESHRDGPTGRTGNLVSESTHRSCGYGSSMLTLCALGVRWHAYLIECSYALS